MKIKESVPSEKKLMLMFGYLCVKDLGNNLQDRVPVLDRFLLSDEEIGLICDCEVGAVQDARYKSKKKKKR